MISDYISFEHALKQTNMKTLQTRRMNLILKFGVKALKNERFKDWFVKNSEANVKTRSGKSHNPFKTIPTRTERYKESPLPYLSNLLNSAMYT